MRHTYKWCLVKLLDRYTCGLDMKVICGKKTELCLPPVAWPVEISRSILAITLGRKMSLLSQAHESAIACTNQQILFCFACCYLVNIMMNIAAIDSGLSVHWRAYTTHNQRPLHHSSTTQREKEKETETEKHGMTTSRDATQQLKYTSFVWYTSKQSSAESV